MEELGPEKWKRTSPIGDEGDFREEGDSALSPGQKTARINVSVSETESTHSFLSLLVKSLYPAKSRQRREVNLSFIFHHIFHERLHNAHYLRSHQVVHCSKSFMSISLNILYILMKRRCKFENDFFQASSTLWSAVQEVSSLVEVALLLSNQGAISCKNIYKLTTLNPSHPVCNLILRPTNLIVFKLLSNLEIIFATISSRLTRLSVFVFNCCGLRLGLKLTSSCNAAAFLKLSHIILASYHL